MASTTTIQKRLDRLENQHGDDIPDNGTLWLVKDENADPSDFPTEGIHKPILFHRPDLEVPSRRMTSNELTEIMDDVAKHGKKLHSG